MVYKLGMKRFLLTSILFLLLATLSIQGFSQPLNSAYDGREASKMPRIGLGYGIFTYFGDVRDNTFSHPFTSSSGAELTVERNINSYLNLYVKAVAGRISINERTETRNLNFQSNLFLGSVNVMYNFNNLYKKPKVLQPFVGLGVGFFNFDSKTDMKDANGAAYNYWSDGSIRNMSETANGAESAKQITRDYSYETDLRTLNTEKRGKYSTLAFSVPIEFGALFRVSPRVTFKLGATYYYNFTNLVDNVTDQGTGVMKGKKGPDNFLFTSFNVSFNLFKETKKEKEKYFENLPDSLFVDIDTKDSDEDGVPDFQDECAATPKGVIISKTGCPLDNDNDGIEDFRDEEEKSTQPLPPVTIDGRNITDSIIALAQPKDSVALQHDQIEKVFANQMRIYGAPVKNFKQGLIDSLTRGVLSKEDEAKIDSLFKAIDQAYDNRQKLANSAPVIPNSEKGVSIPIISSAEKAKQEEAKKAETEAKAKEAEIAVPTAETRKSATTTETKSTETTAAATEPDAEMLTPQERKAIETIVSKQVEGKEGEETKPKADTVATAPATTATAKTETASKTETKAASTETQTTTTPKGKTIAKGADLVPAEYKNFDFNSDGVLTGDEILKAIDMFTDGMLKITSEDLFNMIEFYNSKMKNAKIIDYGVSKGVYIDGVLKIVKLEEVKEAQSKRRKIPDNFRKVDIDNDGVITSKEVDEIIKKHKAGSKLYSADFTNELIDWFFED